MAELIKKIWEVDPLISPGCGGEMKIIVLPDDSEVVAKILKQLNLWSESALDRTRASPQPDSNNSYEPFYDDVQRNPEEGWRPKNVRYSLRVRSRISVMTCY
ncbi:hypothetical protein KAR34_04110 [bacterium]|nr:hypothetical protein [bacterium]